MKILFLVFFIFSIRGKAENGPTAQPLLLPKASAESSSFIGDPDPLDPMPVKNENLKEDDEPVLNDIRQILNAPTKKKSALKKKTQEKVVKTKNFAKKITKTTFRKTSKKVTKNHLTDDGPDLLLEKKLHQIYKRFNSKPTSAEAWSTKTADTTEDTYVVQKGDSLSSISRTLFGDPSFWPKIWSLNRADIENPHFIYPGAKILFFAGEGYDVPTLKVSAKGEKPAEDKTFTGLEILGSADSANSKNNPVGIIPESIPLYRNDSYFLTPQLLEVKFKNLPEIPDDFSNDILLTEKEVISEVILDKNEILKGYCGGEQVLHTELKNSDGELSIYESLETLDTDAGDIFTYRYIGKAKIINANRILITQCKSVLSKGLVFLLPADVNNYRSNQISKQTLPTLIGGPGLGNQTIFSDKQKAYINLGAQPAEIGQVLGIKSQLTEKQSGQVKIIDKFGSFAVGVLTQADDLVETGDELFLP